MLRQPVVEPSLLPLLHLRFVGFQEFFVLLSVEVDRDTIIVQAESRSSEPSPDEGGEVSGRKIAVLATIALLLALFFGESIVLHEQAPPQAELFVGRAIA